MIGPPYDYAPWPWWKRALGWLAWQFIYAVIVTADWWHERRDR